MGNGQRVVLRQRRACSQCGKSQRSGLLVGQEPNSEIVCLDCLVVPDPPLSLPISQIGEPGRSAAREYHRRTLRDRETARRKRPVLFAAVAVVAALAYCGVQILAALVDHGVGLPMKTASHRLGLALVASAHVLGMAAAVGAALVLATRLRGRKQSTDAWAKGSQGEKQLADRLSRLLPKGVVLIHDRRIPGSTANIDHIAVAPSGVFVLDAKNTSGRVETRMSGYGRRRGSTQLFVQGCNRTNYVDGMEKQVAAVRTALKRGTTLEEVPIYPMIVLIGAEWGFLARPLKPGGVWVGWPKAANRLVGQPGPLSPCAISRLALTLAATLPEA